ncbi:MAG: hypothetical protein ABH865_03915 [Candidatus Omnitrophota bacterium]
MLNFKKGRCKLRSCVLSLFFFICCSIFNFDSSIAQEIAGNVVKLSAGTPIVLKLTESVTPVTKNETEIVTFEVAREIKVGNNVVVAAGALAEGTINVSEKAGIVGRPQRIGITLDRVKTVDGKEIMLRGNFIREGKDQSAMSVVIAILICIPFLFMAGGKAEFRMGEELKGYIAQDAEIGVAPTT